LDNKKISQEIRHKHELFAGKDVVAIKTTHVTSGISLSRP